MRPWKRCHVTSRLRDETLFRKHCAHYQRPLACHFPVPILKNAETIRTRQLDRTDLTGTTHTQNSNDCRTRHKRLKPLSPVGLHLGAQQHKHASSKKRDRSTITNTPTSLRAPACRPPHIEKHPNAPRIDADILETEVEREKNGKQICSGAGLTTRKAVPHEYTTQGKSEYKREKPGAVLTDPAFKERKGCLLHRA